MSSRRSSASAASDTAAAAAATGADPAVPGIPKGHVEQLVSAANSYASAHGLEIEKKAEDGAGGGSYFLTAPISLLPNAVPRAAFESARNLAEPFNLLVDRVSRDSDFIYDTLIGTGVARADPYTNKLLQLHRRIYGGDGEPCYADQADRFNIHRSDYMLTNDTSDGTGQIRQIELNTIAASFAGLSCQVSRLHSYLTGRFDGETSAFLASSVDRISPSAAAAAANGKAFGEVPENPALERLPAAMAAAVGRYRDRFVAPASSTLSEGGGGGDNGGRQVAVLFVVQDGESNTVDQRMLEFRLWSDHRIPSIRMSLAKINSDFDSTDGVLTVGKYEIALVYYRAGYAPTDYPGGPDGVEWEARAKLENSRATKAPSLGYHLVGTKKVQQQLARPGVLEKFFPNEPDLVALMRSSFAGLWSLGMEDATDDDLDAVTRALLDGEHDKFVLKPQREGGGYNFYGEDVANKLRPQVELSEDGKKVIKLGQELGEYILMERIFPPLQTAVLLRAGKVEGVGDSLSELGIYGTILTSPDGEVLHNEYAGFLLRTKFSNVNEGGVASGFATLSSPYLC